jgi:hypothetical protein
MRQVIPTASSASDTAPDAQRRGWVPGVSERGVGAADPAAVGVVARARARARDILNTHEVPQLPDDVSRHMDEIMARARRNLVAA